MKPPLVLITRPIADSETLAAAIHGRGYETLIEPMLEIVRRDAIIPPLDSYDALAFTSANAVRAFADLSPVRDRPVFAVGGATAQTLRGSGFQTIRDAGRDAEALAALAGRFIPPGGRILHLSGEAVARDLAALLAGAGIAADRLVLYDARPAETLSDGLVGALRACTIGHVVLLSARTAKSFGTLVVGAGLADRLRSTTALCLSAPIAAEAARLDWKQIGVPAQPTTLALLDLLPLLDAYGSDHAFPASDADRG